MTALKYSTKVPKKAGYYWFRRRWNARGWGPWLMAEIEMRNNKAWFAERRGRGNHITQRQKDCQFAGPIPYPRVEDKT